MKSCTTCIYYCQSEKDDPDEERTWHDVGKDVGLVVVEEEDAEVEAITTTAQERHQKMIRGITRNTRNS